MKKCYSILILTVWVLMHTSNICAQSVKTEQEVRLENYMNKGKYISIAPSNLLNENVRLVLPHLLPQGKSVMYVSEIVGDKATLEWESIDSISGINKLLDCTNYILGTSNYSSLNFYTNSQLRITITADGRVGIGATNPAGALEVNSNLPTIITAPTGEIPDESLDNGQIAFYTVDTSSTIYAKAKKSDGTVVQTKTAQILQKIEMIDLPSIINTTGVNVHYQQVALPGADVDDAVVVNPTQQLVNSIFIAYAYVSAPDTVRICFKNHDNSLVMGYVNNPPMNFVITVIK